MADGAQVYPAVEKVCWYDTVHLPSMPKAGVPSGLDTSGLWAFAYPLFTGLGLGLSLPPERVQ